MNDTVEQATVPEKKSIVPSKYAGRYNNPIDDLSKFITDQCTGASGFEFTAFFELCRKNKLPEDKIAVYEKAIADKAHGAQGRARMTLRNMLAPIARRTSKLVGLSGEEFEVIMPALSPSGAAAKPAEAAKAAKPAEADAAKPAEAAGADEANGSVAE